MKKHRDTFWGVHNYGILVSTTIHPTRRDAIASALSLSVLDASQIRPTVANLKKHCPYYRVVKMTITWDEARQ